MNVWNVHTLTVSSKPVALDEAAYAALRNSQLPGESFSETTKRLAGTRWPVTDFIGIWKDMPEEDFRQIEGSIKQGRLRDRRRIERMLHE